MSSVANLFKPGGLAWRPDANSINAPEGALLRADNMVPDEDGSLSVRRGSRELYSFPLGTEDVRNIYTYEGSSGLTYRLMQADDQVWTNPQPGNHTAIWEVVIAETASLEVLLQMNYTGGNWELTYVPSPTGAVGAVTYTATWESVYVTGTQEPINWNTDFNGTGDIAFGDDHQQAFMARGTSTKKFDGKSFMEWSIAKPAAAPTLSAVAPSSTSLFTCASGETGGTLEYQPTWAGVQRRAVMSFVPDEAGTANQATKVVPGRAMKMDFGLISKWFATDQDFDGAENDIFDVAVKMEDPKHVKYIRIIFLVGTVTGNQQPKKQYSFTFEPAKSQSVPIKDAKIEGTNAYDAKVTTILDTVDPKDKTQTTTPESVKQIIANVGTSETTAGGSAAMPANEWVHLSCMRSQFSESGGASGRGWSTVTVARLQVVNEDGYLGSTSFSDLVFYEATGSLTGIYKVVTQFVRETDRYYEVSPPSAESAAISLFGNQLRVTIAGATQTAADDQVTTVWVFIFGGFLDTYYRIATATLDPQLSTSLVIDCTKNEIDILTENERLPPYLGEAQDNIIAIAGPWNGRLFTLTSAGYVYPSLNTSPSSFNTYQVIDLSNQGDPLWMVRTSSGIHCGCEKDVIFLAGTGDEEADRVVIDLYPHPLNIGTPPFERGCVFVDGNSILYRSTDGLITLASQGLTHVPDDGVRLLWRGQDRHGVSALNVLTGRFRTTVDNKILYVLVAEGATTEGSTVVYRLDMTKGQWSRLIYPNALLSIFNEPDGTLIAGTNDGHVLELEYGTGDEGSTNPSVTIWTPYTDGGNPLVRKDSFDLQFHTNTNSNTATVAVHKDGAVAATSSYTFSTAISQVYRVQAEDVGAFIRAQMRITGTFDEFILSSLNLTYRVRPEHMTYLDTGYFVGDDPSDVVWLQEVEIDANSPSDLYAMVYLDDRLFTTETVTVTANVRTVYRVPLPRGTKSRRPRIVVKTSAADGAGEIGFDPYFVRVRTRNSGNQSQNRFRTVWPVGEAP